MNHEEVEKHNSGIAYNEELQDTHDIYLWLRDAFDEFEKDHHRGVVKRDNTTARRRARALSIELGKRLKEYRRISNAMDSERRRRRAEEKRKEQLNVK